MRAHCTPVPDSPPRSASSARAHAVPIGAHVVPSGIEGNCYFHHSHAEGCRPLRREAAWVATYVPLRYEWGNGIVAGLGHRPILHTKQALFTSRQQKHGGASKFFGVMFTVCKHFLWPCCLADHSHCHHPTMPPHCHRPTMPPHCHRPTMPPPLAQGRHWPWWRRRATKKRVAMRPPPFLSL